MSRRANNQGSVFLIDSKQRWCAQLDGKRKLFRTRGEADEHLRRLLNQRAEGQPIVRNKHTFAEWLPTWLPRHAARKGLSVTTVQTYESYIRLHICPSRIAQRSFDADGWPQAIEDFLTDKLMQGLSPATVRQIRAILSGAFGAAKKAGLIGFNPLRGGLVDAVRVVEPEARFLLPEHTQRLAEGWRDHRHADLYMVLLATGARLGEARGLRWHDDDGTQLVDLKAGTVTLGVKTIVTLKGTNRAAKGRSWDWKPLTKGRKVVTVALAPQAVAALQSQEHRIKVMKLACPPGLWQDLDLVFPSSVGTPFDPSNVLREWKALCDRAGVPRITLHGLRHTSATNDLLAGVPQTVVMDKHGWSQERMVRRYQHVPLALKQQWATEAARFLPTGTSSGNK